MQIHNYFKIRVVVMRINRWVAVAVRIAGADKSRKQYANQSGLASPQLMVVRVPSKLAPTLLALSLSIIMVDVQARNIEPRFFYKNTTCGNYPATTCHSAVIAPNFETADAAYATLVAEPGAFIFLDLYPSPNNINFYNGKISSYDWHYMYAGDPKIYWTGTVGMTFECPKNTALHRENPDILDIYRYKVYCTEPSKPEPDYNSCNSKNPSPKVGNPIFPSTGFKVQVETDYQGDGISNLQFTRTYRSDRNRWLHNYQIVGIDFTSVQTTQNLAPPDGGCFQRIGQSTGESYCFHYSNNVDNEGVALPNDFAVQRGNGRLLNFGTTSDLNPAADINDRVTKITDTTGTVTAWSVYNADDDSTERYDLTGRIRTRTARNGQIQTFTYSDNSTPIAVAPRSGLLIRVTDHLGRQLNFTYDTQGRMATMTDPADGLYIYAYDEASSTALPGNQPASNLTSVTYPDGKKKIYWYNEQDKTANTNLPFALTGIGDETGTRFAIYTYDSTGKAISTEHAGSVEKYSVGYPLPNIQSTVNDALGSVRTYNFTNILGMLKKTSQSQPAGSGCSASTSALTYDANGNIASADDFNAHRTCYVSDLTRNLETARIEGIPNTQACTTVTPPNATLPANSRKTSTEWHPDWRLAIKVAEPGKFTTYVYNGQPDPLSGGAIASCAPSTALLPDGEPIAVLCRQVEQATTDADGHLGLTAALQVGVPKREQKWTYNDFGQVLTYDGPRTDMADITTYAYYDDTATDHTMGDLQSVTNALGQVTHYTKYNPHGQLLESIDPNGIVTTHTYDLRQRLLSTSVNGNTTRYTYDAAGQLLKVTAPDASWIGYEYDPAHRLVATKDNLGNRIDYTLDNAGNRTAESVKDPGGALRRQLSRSIDALGRIQQIIGRE